MKKIILIAAAVAAIAACSKSVPESGTTENTTPESSTSFVKGQQVTLCGGAVSATKVSSESNGSQIDFKWQEGDKIVVKVKSDTAHFKLATGAGTSFGTFTGTMPAGGSTYTVQYPPVDKLAGFITKLSSQNYNSTGGLPEFTYTPTGASPQSEKTGTFMYFESGACSLDSDFSLVPQYSALRLNLWGNKTIGKIVVTNTTSSVSYTLTCKDGAAIGTTEETATPFLLVVPSGDWKFSAEIFDNASTPATICTLSPANNQTFTSGKVLNMPAKTFPKYYPGTKLEGIKIGDVTWAPVNCGYDATNHPYGKLYQFGRAVGCGYVSDPAQSYDDAGGIIQAFVSSQTTTPEDNKFYQGDDDYGDWFSGSSKLTLWPMKSTDSGYVAGKIDNPCPEGWRVPTYDELSALIGGAEAVEDSGWDSTNKGYWFNGTSTPSVNDGLFLPAAGCRDYYYGSASGRGFSGNYWSSSVNVIYAWYLGFYSGDAYVSRSGRAGGYSVRCVQE